MKKRNFLLCLLVASIAVLVSACAFEIPYVGEVEIEIPSFVEDVLVDLGIKDAEEKPSKYTVTFETNGGSAIEAVVSEGTIQEPAAPTKEGHKFVGWYLDGEFTQAVEDFASIEVKENMTLYAKWEALTYTVKFDSMGGSAVESITVEYGNPASIPANPTKEGYEFAGWYLKKDYSKVYANDAIKANTTLYAKWRSAVRFAGTFEGEGIYNASNGTYSFTVQLQIWGRVRIVYDGDLLSMDDEDLTVTGAFTSVNQAPWTPELYCDVPDESATEVDWTTLINSCSNPVNYTFTYNPADHSLDIQAEEILPAVPEVPADGFYIEVYDNNKAYVEGHKVNAAEDGSLTGAVILKQWWRIRAYYNGQALSTSAVTVTGDFDGYNPADKKLYVDLEWETEYDILCDYASEGVEYQISYDPTTNTLDIQDDEEDPVVVIPTEGFAFEHTAPDTTLMAPEVVELGEDGTYTIVIDLAAWRYVVMYYNGVVLDSADETLSYTLSNGFYIDDTGAPSHRFYVNAIGKYQIVYNPTTHTLVAGKYVEPVEPGPDEQDNTIEVLSTDVDSALVVWNTAEKVAISSQQSGYVQDEMLGGTNGQYRLFIAVDAEGKVAYMAYWPAGYGNPNESNWIRHNQHSDFNNNPALMNVSTYESQWGTLAHFDLVVPTGGFLICAHNKDSDAAALLVKNILGLTGVCDNGMEEPAFGLINKQTHNVDDVRLVYDAEAGTITVSHVEEPKPEPVETLLSYSIGEGETTPVEMNEDGSYTIIVDLNQWNHLRLFYDGAEVEVTSDNSKRSDGFYVENGRLYINNIRPSGKYKVVVTPSADGSFSIVAAVCPDENHDLTVGVERTNGVLYGDDLTVLASGTKLKTVTLDENGAYNGYSWASSIYGLYIVVDANGKVIYMVHCPDAGYSGPLDGYYSIEQYKPYTSNPAIVALEGFGPWQNGQNYHNMYEVVVPEGCFAIVAHGAKALQILSAMSNGQVTSVEEASVTCNFALYTGDYTFTLNNNIVYLDIE